MDTTSKQINFYLNRIRDILNHALGNDNHVVKAVIKNLDTLAKLINKGVLAGLTSENNKMTPVRAIGIIRAGIERTEYSTEMEAIERLEALEYIENLFTFEDPKKEAVQALSEQLSGLLHKSAYNDDGGKELVKKFAAYYASKWGIIPNKEHCLEFYRFIFKKVDTSTPE